MPKVLIRWLTAGALSAALPWAAIPVAAQTPGAQRRLAIDALRANDFPGALVATGKLVAATPGDCQAWTLQGLALQGTHNDQAALASFTTALRLCPQLVPALEGAAQIQYTRRSPEARPLLEQLLTIRAADATSHAMLAVLDWQSGDCAAAIPHFEQSAALTHGNPEAEREFASCLLQTGEVERAAALFGQLAQRQPGEALSLQFATALWKARHPNEALAQLHPWLEKDPPSQKTLVLAAQIAEETGDTPHAVAWLRTAILREPAVARNYVLFASFALDHASCQVGINMIDAGLKIVPHPAPLYLARGVLRVQLSQPDAALRDFEQAHRLDPQLSLAEDALGMMHSQEHHGGDALEVFRRHAEQNPDDAFLHYLYAEALSQAEGTSTSDGSTTTQVAIAAANRAISLEPDYQPARDLLATLYLRANDPARAILEADQALKRNPGDQVALYQKLLALRRVGKREEIPAVVARLNSLKQTERETTTQYRLEEGSPASASSPQSPSAGAIPPRP